MTTRRAAQIATVGEALLEVGSADGCGPLMVGAPFVDGVDGSAGHGVQADEKLVTWGFSVPANGGPLWEA